MSKDNDVTEPTVEEAPTRTSKIDTVVELLQREGGADIISISAATGWQAHTVRGAIAGKIRKKLGLAVTTTKVNGRTVYRIGS